jgi:glycosyltransferase involved in cell wall biosynthesis
MNDIFRFSKKSYGGTEYVANYFHENILFKMPKLKKYRCIIIPGEISNIKSLEHGSQDIIFWLHNTIDQYDSVVQNIFNNKNILNNIKYIIVVSNFHKKEIIKKVNINEKKVVVINNGINPLFYNKEKFKNKKPIRIIHASNKERGTETLLNAIKYIDKDFILNIYNDFNPKLYGDEYYADSRVIFHGKKNREEVLRSFSESHIHAYPSTYNETFCLSQVESLSAGCLSVYRDLGSLSEVSNNFGISYFVEDEIHHPHIFSLFLKQAIEDIEQENFDPKIQVDHINNVFSWENISKKWLDFHEVL